MTTVMKMLTLHKDDDDDNDDDDHYYYYCYYYFDTGYMTSDTLLTQNVHDKFILSVKKNT